MNSEHARWNVWRHSPRSEKEGLLSKDLRGSGYAEGGESAGGDGEWLDQTYHWEGSDEMGVCGGGTCPVRIEARSG